MRSFSHNLDRVKVVFDDDRLVADAGLILPATLAARLGLRELFDRHVDLGSVAGAANVGRKALTVIHSVLAGGDSIDDCDALRAGSTAAVLGHAVAAPSTVGTFLRAFSWGHARQIDRVAAAVLARAWAAGIGPGDRPMTIDVDSSIIETYGLQKQGGSRFTYSHVRGYHPLFATVAATGDVVHSRLRGGPANSARGAAGFLTETFRRVRAAGATGPLCARADSGFYNQSVVRACTNAGVTFSITAKMTKKLRALIEGIDAAEWAPIPYFLDDGADVAEVAYQAFPHAKGGPGIDCRLIVRRVRPTPGSQLALFTTWSYHAFITDRAGTTTFLEADHRRHAVVENAIRDLKYGVGLNHLPSGRFGANAAWLGLNVIAHNMSRWSARLGGIDTRPPTHTDIDIETGAFKPARKSFVATDTLRRRYLRTPGRITRSGRRTTLHLPADWPWAEHFHQMLTNLRSVNLTS